MNSDFKQLISCQYFLWMNLLLIDKLIVEIVSTLTSTPINSGFTTFLRRLDCLGVNKFSFKN